MISNNSNFLLAIFATIFAFNVHIFIPASCVYSYKTRKLPLMSKICNVDIVYFL